MSTSIYRPISTGSGKAHRQEKQNNIIELFVDDKVIECELRRVSFNDYVICKKDGKVITKIGKNIDDAELQRLSQIFFLEFDCDYLIAKKLLDWVTGLLVPSETSRNSMQQALLPRPTCFLVCKRNEALNPQLAAVYLVDGKSTPKKLSAKSLYSLLKTNAAKLIFDSKNEFSSLVSYLEKSIYETTADKAKRVINAYKKPPETNAELIFSLLEKAITNKVKLFNAQGFWIEQELQAYPLGNRYCLPEELLMRNCNNLLPPSS